MIAIDKVKNELAAGGSTHQNAENERPDPVVAVVGLVAWAALFVLLAVVSWWMVAFVVGVLVSVLLHEAGHYWTARRSGMKVTQFFIGFGPRIWSFHRNGIEYGLRAIPLGAFVRIIGMNNLDEIPADDERFTYRAATYPRRMWVITAGSVMHMIIAVVLITVVYATWGPYKEQGFVRVTGVVQPGGDLLSPPAYAAGILPGDVVVAIAGAPIATRDDLISQITSQPIGSTFDVELQRDGNPVVVAVTSIAHPQPANPDRPTSYLGIGSTSVDRIRQSFGAASWQGLQDLGTGVGQAVSGIVKVINPVNVFGHLTGSNTDESSRPGTLVGATKISDDFGKADGWAGQLTLLALVNLSVGVFNMFPLLPLDGGHAAIATYERVRSRRGKRYYADVAKLMPVVAVTVAALAFMFLVGLYLDFAPTPR